MTHGATTLEAVIDAIPTDHRVLVGIGGPPGAGKTTLASSLALVLPNAVAVSMDGWHLSNAQLQAEGKAQRKGAPDTIDTEGLLLALQQIQTQSEHKESVYLPAFEHGVGDPIAESICVTPSVETVIFEGNYLLLETQPWSMVRAMFDVRIYCDVPWPVCRKRLIARKINNGKSEDEATRWADRVDFPNHQVISSDSGRGDLRYASDAIGA